VAYGRAGELLPSVATKLTQSPWFLKTSKLCQPPFLHCSVDVGSGGASTTTMSPPKSSNIKGDGGGQTVGTSLVPTALNSSRTALAGPL
jgi:hypothetical protein